MDNIGFIELLLFGGIALVVLGPQKLPGAIRTASLWIGRLKRGFNTIKADIEREIGADEIRRQLRNEHVMDKFRQARSQLDGATDMLRKQAEQVRRDIESEANSAASATKPVSTGENADKPTSETS